MKRFFSLLICLMMVHFGTSQVVIGISDATGSEGGTAVIDVTVNNFNNIGGMLFSINWDPTVFTANSASVINVSTDLPNFSEFNISTSDKPAVDPGELIVAWDLSNTMGTSLPDDHVLFSLQVNLVGSSCSSTDVFLHDEPRPIEITDGNNELVDVEAENGELTIECAGVLTVNFPTVQASSGDQVCMSITADNFTGITAAVFPIAFPDDKLEYVSATTPLPNQTFFSTPEPGIVLFLFTILDPSASVTLPDGSEIVEICFNVIGDSGTTAEVGISDDPDYNIEFTQGDDAIDYNSNSGSVNIQGGLNDVTLYTEDVDFIKGQKSCVPIRVRNFENIQAMQFAIRWDEDNLSFSNTENFNTDLPLDPFNVKLNFTDDAVRVSWSTGFGGNLDDGDILFDMCFDVEGDCDQDTYIEFFADGQPIEFSSSIDNSVLPYVLDPGDITITCPCIIVNKQITDVACYGEQNGAISFEVQGATGNYTCSWDDSSITACSPTGLDADTYAVTVTDEAGCTSTSSFTINEPAEINITGVVADENNGCDGSINISVNGGNGTYSYEWSNSAVTEDVSGLCFGSYTVTVSDGNKCSSTASFNVNAKQLSIDNVTVEDILCNGESTGSISLAVSGGCPDYEFNWEKSGGGITVPNAATINNLSAGTYTVTITDQCSPPSQIVQTYQIDSSPAIEIMVDNVNPSDGMDGAIDVTVIGGSGGYSYLWTPGNYTTEDIANIPGGDFILQVTDSNGCVVNSEAIEVPSSYIKIDLDNTNDQYNGFGVSCNGECDGVIGGEFPVANGEVIVLVNGESTEWPITGLCAGSYELKFTDEKGYTLDTSIFIMEPDALEGTVEDISECSNGNDGAASAVIMGGVEEYNYQWTGGESTAEATSLPQGNITLVVTDANSCQHMISFNIADCNPGGTTEGCYESNQVITPNGDSKNDALVITCLENTVNHIYVFNRVGNLVFEMNDYDNSWSGLDDDGEKLDEDGYLWVIETTSSEGNINIYKGTVTLLRR